MLDLGPGESPHDSIWFLGDERRTVFLGDQVYDRKHAYLADGFFEEWLGHLDRLQRELPVDATLHIGHGGPVTPAQFDEQRVYVETFVDAVRERRLVATRRRTSRGRRADDDAFCPRTSSGS